jgi:hypothetical protein
MNLINHTPLKAAPFLLMDHAGAESLLVVIKGTWSVGTEGTLSIADEQVPIRLSPLYNGDPGSSSLRYDTDVVLEKPGTDCALIGHAWAPKTGAQYVDVTFTAGPVCHQARVFGERRWMTRRLRGASISQPVPFEKVPLTWEHAFGGADTSSPDPAAHEFCLENPVGRGMLSKNSQLEIDGSLLPNIENPADLIQKPGQRTMPRGFGMIAPFWQPRAGYAGSYDDNWRKNISPLPPTDLDPRFYLSSAPGLSTPKHLAGTEQVSVEGACKEGILRFDLPAIRPRASFRCRSLDEEIALQLDTLIVEPDESRAILVWRGCMNVHGKVNEIGAIRVGL